MALYKESTTPGAVHSYRRANRIELINSDVPEARVYAVDRVTYPDGVVLERNPQQIDYALTNPAQIIPIIDPETYEPTAQTFTAGEFYVLAASVALWLMRLQEPTP